ncbi:hypothetical protein ACFSVJ_13720 [Prauserella oleivorans]
MTRDLPVFLDPRGRRRKWVNLTTGMSVGGGAAVIVACGVLLAQQPALLTPLLPGAVPVPRPEAASDRPAGRGGGPLFLFGDEARNRGGIAIAPANTTSLSELVFGAGRGQATTPSSAAPGPGSPAPAESSSTTVPRRLPSRTRAARPRRIPARTR